MSQPIQLTNNPAPRAGPPTPPVDDPLWHQAVKLEAVLFAQLLESAGVGGLGVPGGGDAGPERQFDSFLRQAQAEAVAASGATGLAQIIYSQLKQE